jgi:hypothetical protein
LRMSKQSSYQRDVTKDFGRRLGLSLVRTRVSSSVGCSNNVVHIKMLMQVGEIVFSANFGRYGEPGWIHDRTARHRHNATFVLYRRITGMVSSNTCLNAQCLLRLDLTSQTYPTSSKIVFVSEEAARIENGSSACEGTSVHAKVCE